MTERQGWYVIGILLQILTIVAIEAAMPFVAVIAVAMSVYAFIVA